MRRYVVIAEAYYEDKLSFAQCLGVYADCNTAVGKGYLYMTELIGKNTDYKISTDYEFEVDTGFGFHSEYGKSRDEIKIYFDDTKD